MTDANSTNYVMKPEFDAKFNEIEARMDARVVVIEGKIDSLLNDINEIRHTTIQNSAAIEHIKETVARLDGLRASIWGAAATVIGGVVTIGALGSALFESGRNTAEVAREVAHRESSAMVERAVESAAKAAVAAYLDERTSMRSSTRTKLGSDTQDN